MVPRRRRLLFPGSILASCALYFIKSPAMRRLIAPAAAFALLALAGGAEAQSMAARPSWTTAGYGGAGTSVTTAYDPQTRDANNNRVVINGEIQTAGLPSVQNEFSALSGGAGSASAGAGSPTNTATAVGNLLNVQVAGSWNTVIVSANQTNTGTVTAQAGASAAKAAGNGN
jgi:holdfast attachment protein HfaA